MSMTCIYCKQEIEDKPQLLYAGRNREEQLKCCSADCYNETRRFIEWDRTNRLKCYIPIAVLVVLNLVIIGRGSQVWWQYFPLLGIGSCLFRWPLVFAHYHTYERYGIVTTLKLVQAVAAGIALSGIVFTFLV